LFFSQEVLMSRVYCGCSDEPIARIDDRKDLSFSGLCEACYQRGGDYGRPVDVPVIVRPASGTADVLPFVPKRKTTQKERRATAVLKVG
jgi:hypothetical protein